MTNNIIVSSRRFSSISLAVVGLAAAFALLGSVTHLSAQEKPKPLTICIDPGHPSEVNSGRAIQNGTTETHIDWVVAVKLKALLQRSGYRVIMTKSSENEMVKNKERALIGNRANADLTIRLHCDAGAATGYALYYPDRQGTSQRKTGPSEEIMSRSLAAAKSLEQGMSSVILNALKDGGVRGDFKTLIGSKQGALTGSIFSEIPIVTIEMVVLSNPKDAEFIKAETGQIRVAEGIARGVDLFRSKIAETRILKND